jgi:hypothetical protein
MEPFLIVFGKHRGKKSDEIMRIDPRYFWHALKSDVLWHKHTRVMMKIEKLIDHRSNVGAEYRFRRKRVNNSAP